MAQTTDDLLSLIYEIQASPPTTTTTPTFVVPTARQAAHWLRETQGRAVATYSGALSMQQQAWLVDDLLTADREVVHHHVHPLLLLRTQRRP
jgi:hypothetical protein